jgi:hypothetical protein
MDNDFLIPSNDEDNTAPNVGKETYYKMTIDDLEFQFLYKELGIRKAVYVIDSLGKECASIYVDENTNEEENETRELLLSKVTYKPSCKFGGHMLRGQATITMLKGLLAFAMKMISGYAYIIFMDDSHIDCELPGTAHKAQIPLAYFEFILYGKTWYEKHFGATLDEQDVERMRKIDVANGLLMRPVDGDFVPFWRKMVRLGNQLRRLQWYKNLEQTSKELFELHKEHKQSWRSFFYEILGKYGKVSSTLGENIGCSLFTTMMTPIQEMFVIPILHQTHWKIARSTIERYPAFMIDAEANDTPVHIKKTETKAKLALTSMYTIGGRTTRKNKRTLKYVPRGYGGTISFLCMRGTNSYRPRGTRKMTR